MLKAVGGSLAALAVSTVLVAAAVGGVATQLLGSGGTGSTPSTTALTQIPPDYLALYQQAAATCPGLDWTVLAGIGKTESDHGQSTLPGVHAGANAAGAEGPMQFEPATFAQYANPVPSGGAEPPSPYDPADAIYAAARMLCANGARSGTNLHAALYAYNHTQTYVSAVLTAAAAYGTPAGASPAGNEHDWTPAVGQQIAVRALRWLGWPYAFDGGNARGPTHGKTVDYASRNDAHVNGFDCSGLVLYAVAPWLALEHSAAAQYTEAGAVHPPPSELLPGDLVFWSSNGTVAGIGHVAIYLGGGRVVQAPYSGAYIEVSPLSQVESGYFGSTRPLSQAAGTQAGAAGGRRSI